jgi:hypothetical protein
VAPCAAHRDAVAYLAQARAALAQRPERRAPLEQARARRVALHTAWPPLAAQGRRCARLRAPEALAARRGEAPRLSPGAGPLGLYGSALGA